jgi:hypothetical protein
MANPALKRWAIVIKVNGNQEREKPDSAEENFVDITPCPIFARLKGSNDRMRGGVKMFRGVAIRRGVTATHVAAR